MLAKPPVSPVVSVLLALFVASVSKADDPATDPLLIEPEGTEIILDEPPPPDGVEFAPAFNTFDGSYVEPPPAGPEPWSMDGVPHFIQRFGAGVDVGDGIGFDENFATFEYMTPLGSDFVWDILFTDLRLLVREGSKVGANLGLAYRTYDLDRNRIYGANIFYDYRETAFNEFGQVGLGAESLGPIWDFRANFYMPLSDSHGRLPNGFVGNGLVLRDEFALSGADFEVGVNLWDTERVQGRVLAGLYHFNSKNDDEATGWRLRAEGAVDGRYWLDTSVQHDEVFGTTASVGLAIRWADRFLPYGIPARATSDHKFFRRPRDVQSGSIAHRLSAPIERLQNIVVQQRIVSATDAAGAPISFLHVVEGAMGGDGTFEAPYGTITDALADGNAGTSVIYTPFGGTYNENVALVAGAQVLSNGPAQTVDTQLGPQAVPFSGTGVMPTLTGDVAMADDTRFSGFDVSGSISATNVMNVALDNNRVVSAADAVTLTGVGGAVLDNLSLSSTGGRGLLIDDSDAVVTDVSVTGATDDGVEVVVADATDRTVAFSNLSVTGVTMNGVDVDVAGAGSLEISFDGATSVTAMGTALDASLGAASTGNLDLTVDGGTLESTMGEGIRLEKIAGAGGEIVNASLTNTTVIAETDAVVLSGVQGVVMPDLLGADLDSLTLSSSVGRGLQLNDSNATITNLTVSSAADDGVEINSTATDRTVKIIDLTSASGIDVNVNGAGNLEVSFEGLNDVSSSGNSLDAELGAATTGNLTLALNGLTLKSTAGAGARIARSMGAGTIFVTSLSDVTVKEAMTGGFLVDGATFDTMQMGMNTVNATLTVGNKQMPSAVKGNGVELSNLSGGLTFDSLKIFNESGVGLLADTGSAGFTLASTPGSTIMTSMGPALELRDLDVDLQFDSVQSDDSMTNGVIIDNVTGKLDVAKTTLNLSATHAISIQNTAAPLAALFGETSIHSAISSLYADNVDADPMANPGLNLGFDSLEIIFP